MPLLYGAKNVGKNIEELYTHGTKPRSRDQIIAIAEAAAHRRPKQGKRRGARVTPK